MRGWPCSPSIQVLLLVIVAVPTGAHAIRTAIIEAPDDVDGLLWLLLQERPDTPDWEHTRSFRRRLCATLESLPTAEVDDLGLYRQWAPRLVRHSFHIGPLRTDPEEA